MGTEDDTEGGVMTWVDRICVIAVNGPHPDPDITDAEWLQWLKDLLERRFCSEDDESSLQQDNAVETNSDDECGLGD